MSICLWCFTEQNFKEDAFCLRITGSQTSLSNACGTDHNAIADPVAIAIQAACDSVLGQHLAAGVLTPVEILGQHDQVDGQVSNNDPGAPVGFECNGVAQSLQELSLSGGDVTTHGSREHSESDNGSEVDMGNEVESVSEYDTVYNDSEVGVGSEVADFSDCANATDAEEIIKQKTYVCVICEDVQSTEADILTAPCAHNYCRACTVESFRMPSETRSYSRRVAARSLFQSIKQNIFSLPN